MMDKLWILVVIFGLIFVATTALTQKGESVDVRSGINHSDCDD
jgi:hypothetical protein